METRLMEKAAAPNGQPVKGGVFTWRRYLQTVVSAGFILLLLFLWELVAALQVFEPSLFPSPSGIYKSFGHWMSNGGLFTAVVISLKRALVGYGIALAMGVPVGMAIGRSRLADWTLGTLVRILQPIPGIAWIPLAVVWFTSVSETAKVFIIVTGSIFPIVISTSVGVRTVPPIYLRVAHTLGVDGLQLFTKVLFPAIVPNIIGGMRIAWAFCWRALVASEIVLASRTGPGQEGIGGLLGVARQFGDINSAGMVMVVLACLGLAVDGIIFGSLEHNVRQKRGLG